MKKNNSFPLFVSILTIVINSGCCSEKAFLDQYDAKSVFLSEISEGCIHTLRGMDIDKQSNIYTAGNIFGNVKVCNMTVMSAGHSGLFVISKPDLTCKKAIQFISKDESMNLKNCFMSCVVVDNRGFILVTGYFNGNLLIGTEEKIKSTGKYQSFLAKFDTSGNLIWCKDFQKDIDGNFILMDLAKTSTNIYSVIGILDDKQTLLMELDENGNKTWMTTFDEKAPIYHCTLIEVGSSIYTSTIGTDFINLRRLDEAHDVKWKFLQKTGADLLAIKSYLAADINNGIWIATTFTNNGNKFHFGDDTVENSGKFDGYITEFKNDKQIYSAHIKGSEDKIVTGLFSANNKTISFGLAHGDKFEIQNLKSAMPDLIYENGKGLSLINFNRDNPKKITYSVFPVTTTRETMVNSGLYFRTDKSGNEFVGGTLIRGDGQPMAPTIKIGDETLTAQHTYFNSFLVKGTPKHWHFPCL
ncbi:MAG: hypothetical protein IPP15_21250 [Saprospiraceae bacterium]|uniref:Uncharacterized protein n=1 Tax=Candidatus Opimibacter skivensis TaxID=2982028 RepID=A0A9D7SX44_9BACT|nr:hypothetical protein [Candidatus Opimibacter skivensis]